MVPRRSSCRLRLEIQAYSIVPALQQHRADLAAVLAGHDLATEAGMVAVRCLVQLMKVPPADVRAWNRLPEPSSALTKVVLWSVWCESQPYLYWLRSNTHPAHRAYDIVVSCASVRPHRCSMLTAT
jgi:hypothetical protein